jgi:hypothetical protein
MHFRVLMWFLEFICGTKNITLNLQLKPLPRIQIKSLQTPFLAFMGIIEVVTKKENPCWATLLLSPPSSH